ncbi:CbtB domain-containing protein [Solicola sp. PLA-1-18]|uniref:CbtB domain-containing protein n=1 Tax=Solicola sp. PLA-1-18 TaxID=3380532 RepID=UPI003B78D46D
MAPSNAPAVSPSSEVVVPAISGRQVLPWLLLLALVAVLAVYFVGAEQGATSLFSGTAIHEWTHDGRHLLGFPCH